MKTRGVFAKLETYNAEGKCVGDELVFKPFCEFYSRKYNDGLAVIGFQDVGPLIEEIGLELATQVINGEIVEAECEIGDEWTQVACPVKTPLFEKRTYKTQYPFMNGGRELLVQGSKIE